LLAIIIPYYKIIFFEETLKSLANQTDKRFKVYIGNDASLENPSLLLENYKRQINIEHHQFENNLGSISLVRQWERCIALIDNEEWIMILGDDDVLGENVVEYFYRNINFINVESSNVVRYATYKIDGTGTRISNIYQHPVKESAVDVLFRKTRSSLSEYIFKKEKVNKIKFKDFPLGWFSDILAVFEFSDFKNIFSINDAVLYIRISSESISGSSSYEVLKATASFKFYHYLLSNYSLRFSKSQIKILQNNIQKCYLNNKRVFSFLIGITKLYLKKSWIKSYCNFLIAILNFFFKKQ